MGRASAVRTRVGPVAAVDPSPETCMTDTVPAGPPRFPDDDLARYARLADAAGLPLSLWLARAAAAARTGSREVQLTLALDDSEAGTTAPADGAGARSVRPGDADAPAVLEAQALLEEMRTAARDAGRAARLTVHADGEASLDGPGGIGRLSGGPDLAVRLLRTLRQARRDR